MKKEFVCRQCDGTGDMITEPGGDGYAPVYDTCIMCDGTGIEIQDTELIYKEC